jgi:hypothetical protein
LDQPIDVLCFGRAGVGKTTLLEALTNRELGSTPRLDHGTEKLEAVHVTQEIPMRDGRTKEVTIRFWDTKGIDKWSGDGGDVATLFSELERQKVRPLCVFYCACGAGRVDTVVVKNVLKYYHDNGIVVFWVVTNMYSHSEEQFMAQMDEATEIMRELTGESSYPVTKPGNLMMCPQQWISPTALDARPFWLLPIPGRSAASYFARLSQRKTWARSCTYAART